MLGHGVSLWNLALLSGSGPTLAFTGSTTLAEDFNDVAFTLVVLNDPGGLYDTFTETTDADGIATLAGDEVTISGLDYETKTSHTLVYTASGTGVPDLTLTVTITVTDVDEAAPTLQSTSPADNATSVSPSASLTATFNENIQFGTGSIDLYDADDDLIESFDVETDVGTGNGEVSISGAVLTINPTASMEEVKGHYVQIDATAIEDLAGNAYAGIADKTTWNFTTADTVAPTVSSFSPADNATGVAVDATLVVTFNENVSLGASGVITLKKTSDDSTIDSWDVATDSGSSAGQCEITNDDELTLHLTGDLDEDVEYYVIWDAGVVKDASNNNVAALSSTTTWSFTTVSASSFSFDYVNTYTDGADRTTFTFSAASLGSAPGGGETRYIVVAVGGAGLAAGRTVSSVTIAGVSAAAVTTDITDGDRGLGRIYIAEVSSGTTGDIVVTFSAAMAYGAVHVFRMMNPTSSTAFATGSDGTHASGVLDLNCNTPAGGAVMAANFSRNSGTTTWVGVTKDVEVDAETTEYTSCAHATGTSSETPRTITSTSSLTTPNNLVGVSASWV